MSQNAKTANGLVKGLLNSSRAFVLGTALLAGSMTMLSTTHAQAEKSCASAMTANRNQWTRISFRRFRPAACRMICFWVF